MQLLSQVLRTLISVHAAGYAHRNIKPSNILRRPKQHDWILTDFACAAAIGALPPTHPTCLHSEGPSPLMQHLDPVYGPQQTLCGSLCRALLR